jgi:hypothetical protein
MAVETASAITFSEARTVSVFLHGRFHGTIETMGSRFEAATRSQVAKEFSDFDSAMSWIIDDIHGD